MTNDNDKKRAFPTPKAEQNFTRWTNDTRALLAQIDSLVIQRDAAEALARGVVEGLRPIAAAQIDSGRNVVEVVGLTVATVVGLRDLRDRLESQVAELTERVDVLTSERDEAKAYLRQVKEERDAAVAEAWRLVTVEDRCKDAESRADRNETARRDAVALWTTACEEMRNAKDGWRRQFASVEERIREVTDDYTGACRMRDAAERRESELGLQVVAQAARMRLAESTIATVRRDCRDSSYNRDALAAWDAVPGDVGGEG